MLKSLKVENIALIEEQYIEFYKGLNVLSGETGAGKSIIINALCFALGSRADKSLIRNGADYAKVTAVFEVDLDEKLSQLLQELDVEPEESIIVVRKMFVDGKSEIKVNGTSVSLSMLKKLTTNLIDVYGQFEHTNLLDERKHLQVLDDYGGQEISQKFDEYKAVYDELLSLKAQIKALGGDERERMNKIDFLQYEINEINLVNPQLGEDEQLQAQKSIMVNAEKLAEAYGVAKSALDGEEYSARLGIGTARNKLQSIADINPAMQPLTERLYSLEAELDDIISEITSALNSCEYDEREFNEVDSRLDSIKMLKKKYGNTILEVLEAKQKAEEELSNLQNSAELLQELNQKIEKTTQNLQNLSESLSKTRKKYAEQLQNEILSQLKDLGMGKSQFVVQFEPCEFSASGADKVEFMFSANLGEPVKNLNKIISGGELSRFMLALKSSLAKISNIGTQIYDEIDAGISGHIGQVIAIKLSKISKDCQVITISHLPQIVAMADFVFRIEKFEKDGKTYSRIEQLDAQQALKEIARLSGGENIGEHSLVFAKEMQDWANKAKNEA